MGRIRNAADNVFARFEPVGVDDDNVKGIAQTTKRSMNAQPFLAPIRGIFLQHQEIDIAVTCHLTRGRGTKEDYPFRRDNARHPPYDFIYDVLIYSHAPHYTTCQRGLPAVTAGMSDLAAAQAAYPIRRKTRHGLENLPQNVQDNGFGISIMNTTPPARGLFTQNVIAVIWDFDRTLSPHYMQAPLFAEYGIDSEEFWSEVGQLPAFYARAGITMPRDVCYLGHLLAYVEHGRMPDLTNAKLCELGGQIGFYPGIPELFDDMAAIVAAPEFAHLDLHVEHYVVSTGLAEMIRGSRVASKLSGVWACEFVETPARPGDDLTKRPVSGPIRQIACFLDHTTKTRALFEINKGVNRNLGISVNDLIPEEERRVPFKNMIYLADGPSDIPSFSVVRHNGGMAYAVYDPASPEQFAQAVALLESERVDAFGAADYRPGTQTHMWLQLQVRRIAERIASDRKQSFTSRVAPGPVHLKEPKTTP